MASKSTNGSHKALRASPVCWKEPLGMLALQNSLAIIDVKHPLTCAKAALTEYLQIPQKSKLKLDNFHFLPEKIAQKLKSNRLSKTVRGGRW